VYKQYEKSAIITYRLMRLLIRVYFLKTGGKFRRRPFRYITYKTQQNPSVLVIGGIGRSVRLCVKQRQQAKGETGYCKQRENQASKQASNSRQPCSSVELASLERGSKKQSHNEEANTIIIALLK